VLAFKMENVKIPLPEIAWRCGVAIRVRCKKINKENNNVRKNVCKPAFSFYTL